MGGVAVVGAEQKAVGQRPVFHLGAVGDGFENPVQHVPQEAALGALPAGGTHLLVIEHGPDGGAGAVRLGGSVDEAQQGGGGAFQVVDAGGHEVLPVGADLGGGLAGHQLEIPVEDVPFLHPQLLAEQVGEGAARLGAPQGLHVDLGVVLVALVHVALHVDGQGRDHQEVPVKVDKAGLHPVGGAHQHPAGHRQGAVQPGGHVHAAVALHAQAAAAVIRHGVGLDLPARGVAVAGGDAPPADGMGGNAPGHHGGTVAQEVVPLARFQVPVVGLLQTGEARRVQPGRRRGRRMVGGHALLQKFKQIVDHTSISPSHSPGTPRRPGFFLHSTANTCGGQVATGEFSGYSDGRGQVPRIVWKHGRGLYEG